MVFNATFNKISATGILWWSVLLVEESGVPEENHQPVTSHWQTLSHNVVSSTPRLSGVQLTTLVVMELIAQVAVKPTTIRSWPWRPLIQIRPPLPFSRSQIILKLVRFPFETLTFLYYINSCLQARKASPDFWDWDTTQDRCKMMGKLLFKVVNHQSLCTSTIHYQP